MRQMFMALVVVASGAVAPVMSSVPAQADSIRWCAVYGGRGGTNCGFYTYAQCRAAISGLGGFCQRDAFSGGGRWYR